MPLFLTREGRKDDTSPSTLPLRFRWSFIQIKSLGTRSGNPANGFGCQPAYRPTYIHLISTKTQSSGNSAPRTKRQSIFAYIKTEFLFSDVSSVIPYSRSPYFVSFQVVVLLLKGKFVFHEKQYVSCAIYSALKKQLT